MKRIKISPREDSDVIKFRKRFLKKGYELADITQLCTFRLGNSGVCNGFNEPDENIYHIQVYYRDEEIGAVNGNSCYAIDEYEYVFFTTNEDDITGADFIIFKLCKR